MAVKDTWRRALEYFGLVEGDYLDEGEYTDEHDITGDEAAYDEPAPTRRERIPDREPREARAAPRRTSRRMADADDIFSDDDPMPGRRSAGLDAGGNGGDLSMHLVTPRSFNDAQQVADEYKRSKPVILNLQTTDRELAKRLIDFCSGLTYALGGGMQRIAERIFLLTPENVDVSAEEKARLLERGFFNQS